MIYRRDYRTLIDQGRKAGLGTGELYRALAAQRSEGNDPAAQQADSNGFIPAYSQTGRRIFRQVGEDAHS